SGFLGQTNVGHQIDDKAAAKQFLKYWEIVRKDPALADARAAATKLPHAGHVLNLCADRYRFAVGFAAALIAGSSSVLPSSTAPLALRRLRDSLPGLIEISDSEPALDGVHVRIDARGDAETDSFDVPLIDGNLIAAIVYTSGTTGEPVGHPKRWESLVRCLKAGALRLGLDGEACSIVATVPPQHMYGFEVSVLLPWVAGHAACAERPLHAAEVASVLQSVPSPRVLVTTPVHLRALIASEIAFPAIELIVSATAPLGAELASEAERRFGAPLREIYGSTETGEIATRRTALEQRWVLWPGVTLEPAGDGFLARGGHLDAPMPLHDLVVPVDAGSFLLQGRRADLVNIAGKRSSVGYLDHQLLSIDGVVDGSFIVPPDAVDGTVTRLAALVVAPTLTVDEVRRELQRRIDAAFLPRPLLKVERLPRNDTGKLPLAAALAVLASDVS
ncbi:MAG: AMP-binding protein, partial [Steroidobacteraceae bacterium]